MAVKTDGNAFALRPFRVDAKKNVIVLYEGTTFPTNPHDGCEMYLRRLEAFGFIVGESEESALAVDVLSGDGDILDTIMISRPGFEYLRRQLKFRVERD